MDPLASKRRARSARRPSRSRQHAVGENPAQLLPNEPISLLLWGGAPGFHDYGRLSLTSVLVRPNKVQCRAFHVDTAVADWSTRRASICWLLSVRLHGDTLTFVIGRIDPGATVAPSLVPRHAVSLRSPPRTHTRIAYGETTGCWRMYGSPQAKSKTMAPVAVLRQPGHQAGRRR